MKPLHIEGMGLLGTLLAHRLDGLEMEYTWHDDDTRNAWRASTGLVYPAGDDRSQRGLHRWLDQLDDPVLGAFAEEVAYVYAHKHPPHEGRYTPTDHGSYRVAPRGSAVAVNVARLVMAGRSTHADRRTAAPEPWERLVRAHGFNRRMGSVMWGWAAPIRLDTSAVEANTHGLRQAFYSKLGRFQIVYAYPIPGTDKWWAGSVLQRQQQAKDVPEPMVARHTKRWVAAWEQLWPQLPITWMGDSIQGWRPRPTAEPADNALVIDLDGVLTFPPLWHSGVRWSPMVIDQAIERLTA